MSLHTRNLKAGRPAVNSGIVGISEPATFFRILTIDDISRRLCPLKVMAEFSALAEAVLRLSESIADFPVGAISLNDLKSTGEKIQDLRATLKKISSAIIVLRAKEEARAITNIPEEAVAETYEKLQDRLAQCAINNRATEICLYSDAIEQILQDTEDTEMKRSLQDLMQKLFVANDKLITLEAEKVTLKEQELELIVDLKRSILEFKDFLLEQRAIRSEKLKETNPQIAEQKAQMQKRVQKINVMKRLITNMIAASGGVLRENTFLQEMMKKHRELVDPEMIAKMALEVPDEEP